jgi:hypothetical protein
MKKKRVDIFKKSDYYIKRKMEVFMYAVEFETVVEDKTIHIPEEFQEFESHNVKVILMMAPEYIPPVKRIPGTAKGKVVVYDDFEQPLDEETVNLFY